MYSDSDSYLFIIKTLCYKYDISESERVTLERSIYNQRVRDCFNQKSRILRQLPEKGDSDFSEILLASLRQLISDTNNAVIHPEVERG